MSKYDKIIKRIEHATNCLIITHRNPDPDAFCSSYAFTKILQSQKKTVTFFSKGPAPKFESKLGFKVGFVTEVPDLKYFDTIFVLDCGSSAVIEGTLGESLKKLPGGVVVEIDHHQDADRFTTISFCSSKFSSTCEIIARIAFNAKWELKKEVSNLLLMGIITDSGSFAYPVATAQTFSVASKLLRRGADKNEIMYKYLKTYSEGSIRIWASLVSSYKTTISGKVAYIIVDGDTERKYKLDLGIVHSDILAQVLKVEEIMIAILIRDVGGGRIRINARSANEIDSTQLTIELGGGGHRNASGASTMGDLSSVVSKVVNRAEELYGKL